MATFYRVTHTIGGKSVAKLAERIADVRVRTGLMQDAGEMAVTRILGRTAQGRDVQGRSFAPYEPSTVRIRARAGLPTSPVSLSFTGAMLDSLKVSRITRDRAWVNVAPSEQKKASYHNVVGVGRKRTKRRFNGLSASDKSVIGAWFKKEIDLRITR